MCTILYSDSQDSSEEESDCDPTTLKHTLTSGKVECAKKVKSRQVLQAPGKKTLTKAGDGQHPSSILEKNGKCTT